MLSPLPERPKIADASLSVVMLARENVEHLDGVLRAWLEWLNQRPGESELLVMVSSAGARDNITTLSDPRLRIIHHVAPEGGGACLQSAIALARHPLLLTTTADGQFQPAEAAQLIKHIDPVDVVCGCRVAGPPPIWLRALGLLKRVFTRIALGYAAEPRAAWLGWRGLGQRCRIRFIFGLKLRDAGCVFRLYRTEMLRRIPIQSLGDFAHIEVLAKANHLGCWMAEAPVAWTPPPQLDHDAHWRSDQKTVRRRPEFAWT